MNDDLFQGPIAPDTIDFASCWLIDVLWDGFNIQVTDGNGSTVVPLTKAALNPENHISVHTDSNTGLPVLGLETTCTHHEFAGVIQDGKVIYPVVTCAFEGMVLHIRIDHTEMTGRKLVTEIWATVQNFHMGAAG